MRRVLETCRGIPVDCFQAPTGLYTACAGPRRQRSAGVAGWRHTLHPCPSLLTDDALTAGGLAQHTARLSDAAMYVEASRIRAALHDAPALGLSRPRQTSGDVLSLWALVPGLLRILRPGVASRHNIGGLACNSIVPAKRGNPRQDRLLFLAHPPPPSALDASPGLYPAGLLRSQRQRNLSPRPHRHRDLDCSDPPGRGCLSASSRLRAFTPCLQYPLLSPVASVEPSKIVLMHLRHAMS